MRRSAGSIGVVLLALAAWSCRAVLGVEDSELVAAASAGAAPDASAEGAEAANGGSAGSGGSVGSGGSAGGGGSAGKDAGQDIDATVELDATTEGGCEAGLAWCSGSCVDLDKSGTDCGSCGNTCTTGFVCRTGSCRCPEISQVDCNGACRDIFNDPSNCGACGHDCVGGGCYLKRCKAIELAATVATVNDLDVTLDKVVFTMKGGSGAATGSVRSMGKDGSGQTVLLGGQMTVTELAASEDSQYFMTSDGVTIKKRVNGIVSTVSTSEGVEGALDLRLWAGVLYWIRRGSPATIRKYTTSTATSDLVTGLVGPGGLAADATGLYWTATGSDGLVQHAPFAGGSPNTIVNYPGATPTVGGIAIGGEFVFFLYGAPLNLWSAPKAGGAPTAVTSGATAPIEVIASNDMVFWSMPDGIYQRPILGGNSEMLIGTSTPPTHIAADAQAVYWTDATAQTVMKVAR